MPNDDFKKRFEEIPFKFKTFAYSIFDYIEGCTPEEHKQRARESLSKVLPHLKGNLDDHVERAHNGYLDTRDLFIVNLHHYMVSYHLSDEAIKTIADWMIQNNYHAEYLPDLIDLIVYHSGTRHANINNFLKDKTRESISSLQSSLLTETALFRHTYYDWPLENEK